MAQGSIRAMAEPIKMPELGESITEGTITRWLKQEGDQVQADEPLFEVSTDKVDTEVPSPIAGVLTSIKVHEDETVAVGTELAEIAEEPAAAAEAADAGGETVTVRMPELGESITEGTITRWLKQEGDQVQADEPLFEVSTDKVDTEVPSPVAGRITSIKVQEDQTVGVGAELVEIATGAGGGRPARQPVPQAAERPAQAAAADGGQPAAPPAEPAAATATGTRPAAPPAGNGGGAGTVPEGMVVSPLVRRLAREHRIDLGQIRGSGAGGRVRREDVEAFLERRGAQPAAASAEAPAVTRQPPARAEAPAAAAPRPAGSPGLQVAVPLPTGVREEVVKATRTRRLIAERMVTSLQVSAQLTAAVEVDMTKVMRRRGQAVPERQLGTGRRRQPARLQGRQPRGRGRHAQGPVRARDQARRHAQPCGARQGHRRRGRPHPRRQDLPGRAVRLDHHRDQHRQPGHRLGHPDHQPAQRGRLRHAGDRPQAGGGRRPGPRRGRCGAAHDVRDPDLRPPHHRRRRRRALPDQGQGGPRGGRLLRRAGTVVMGAGGPPLWLVRAGRVPYRLAWAWQRELVERRVADEIPDTVLLLEHPHVYTIGKRGSDGDVLASEDWLRALGAEVVRTERGGQATYHGPGQLVGYPITRLDRTKGVWPFIARVEDALVDVAADFGLQARGEFGALTGVWVGDAKLVAIGMRVSREVTSHGFALNCSTDLSRFNAVIPCRMPNKAAWLLYSLLDRTVTVEEALPLVERRLAERLERTPSLVDLATLELEAEAAESDANARL